MPTDPATAASVSLEDWRFDTEGSLTHALCGSVYEVPPCSLTRLLALTEQHVCPEVQVIAADPCATAAWFVNVASPFPRERRDRNYGPFTEDEAQAFADALPRGWRAEIRPLFPADEVRSP